MYESEGQVSFLKVVVLTILAVGAGVGTLLYLNQTGAGDAGTSRQSAMEKYVRAHRCVVAFEDRSIARLYQCGTGDNISYITPTELRKAAKLEAAQGVDR